MKKAVLMMPDATHLRHALHTIRHMSGAEMALVLPPDARHVQDVVGLEQVLAWARERGKDVTLIGGGAELRAEAVAQGWRVSTSLADWEQWLAETAPTPLAGNKALGWRILRASGADEEQLRLEDAAPLPLAADANPAERLTSDEQHEEAVIALIWQTGKLTEIPAAFQAS